MTDPMTDPINHAVVLTTNRTLDVYQEVAVVPSNEVWNYTEKGWTVLGIGRTSRVESTIRDLPPTPEDRYPGSVTVPVVLEQMEFIVGRLKADADLAKKHEMALELARKRKGELDKLTKQLETKDKQITLSSEHMANLENSCKQYRDESRELRTRLRKYEGDMWKLREAFGTKAMNDVLKTDEDGG